MEYEYEKSGGQIRIVRCFAEGGIVELPEEIEGCPVTEIGAYAFSAHGGRKDEQTAVCGEKLTEIILPGTIRVIGKYAFYGCSSLKRIVCYTNIADIGAGAFTGCHSVRNIDVTVADGSRSCLRELLLELREEQTVSIHSSAGEAKLVFPEFFEEAVENTPARILETHTHGSGMWYRNCFVQTELQFDMYDKRFPWAKGNERTELLLELSFGRLLYPLGLGREAEEQYREFLRDNLREAALWALERQGMEELCYLAECAAAKREELELLIRTAGKSRNAEAFAMLMDQRHRLYPDRVKKADKFDL